LEALNFKILKVNIKTSQQTAWSVNQMLCTKYEVRKGPADFSCEKLAMCCIYQFSECCMRETTAEIMVIFAGLNREI